MHLEAQVRRHRVRVAGVAYVSDQLTRLNVPAVLPPARRPGETEEAEQEQSSSGCRAVAAHSRSGSRSRRPTLAGNGRRAGRNSRFGAVIGWLMRFRLAFVGALAAALAAAATAGAAL